MSNLCDFSSSIYVVRNGDRKHNYVHVCSCIARCVCVCVCVCVCAAALLGVYVCAHAFLHHLKLVRCLVLVQTKNKPTTSSVQNQVSIAYTLSIVGELRWTTQHLYGNLFLHNI